MIDYIADEFQKTEGIDLRKDPMALQRLREAGEKSEMRAPQNECKRKINFRSSTATADVLEAFANEI